MHIKFTLWPPVGTTLPTERLTYYKSGKGGKTVEHKARIRNFLEYVPMTVLL